MVDPNEKDDIIEIECEDCQAEFEIRYSEADNGEPVYCPFCGADLNYEFDDKRDELYDEDEENYEDR